MKDFDFSIGIEICVKDIEGNDIRFLSSYALSDKTISLIMEDVQRELNDGK
jgi:hypothetical protein